MVAEVGNEVKPEVSRLYSQREVSEVLGLDHPTVNRLCMYGVIDTVRDSKNDKFLGITKEELSRLKVMPRGIGKGYLPIGRTNNYG